jgi:hypothetical protein
MNHPASRERNAAPRYAPNSRRALLTAAAVASLLALAACSSGGGSKPASDGTPTGGTATESAVLTQSRTLLKNAAASAVTGPSVGKVPASQIVPWTPSLMPAPVNLPTGKSIRIDVVYAIPVGFTPYSAHLIQVIAQKLGWQVKVIQATANTAQAALAAMQQAVLDKPTAIITSVIPGVWVGQALAKAKSEGIYTIDMHQDSTDGPGYDAWVPDGEGIQKALLAAYAVTQSKGSAKTLLVTAPGFSDSNIPATAAYLGKCSGCSTTTTQFNPADFTDPATVQSDVTAKLAAGTNPGYIVWPDGGLPIQPVINAISASSTDTTAKVLINDASPGSIQPLKAGQLPIVVYAPSALMPLIAVDDVNRMVQGQKPLAENALRFPVSYWTTQNSPAPSYPAITAAQLKNTDWLSPYEKAWHIKLKSALLAVPS